MIKKFEVENFKNFKEKVVFDLTARDYVFNNNIVVNGIVNKAIIYGKNGIGKSNLGVALFDIIFHLTDKEKMPNIYLFNYLNLNSEQKYATFKYYFQFDEDEIIYEYKKVNANYLLSEALFFNGKKVVDFDYFNRDNNYIDKDLAGDLRIELVDNKLSILKYIYRNTLLDKTSLLHKMMDFVDRMLWFRCLSDGNVYCGYTNGGALLVEGLYASGKKTEFEKFLAENGLDYNLKWITVNGIHELMVEYANGKQVPFLSVASTGTKSLFLFFYWSIVAFDNISFLFIDEFDAFFHYESAENIVLKLNKNRKFQTVLTSHNTYLMKNNLTRPDCCYIMTENKITSLNNATSKEIREAHNLEKMYINGAFNE